MKLGCPFFMKGIYHSESMAYISQHSDPNDTDANGGGGFYMNSHNAKHTHMTHTRNCGPRSEPNFQCIYIYTYIYTRNQANFVGHNFQPELCGSAWRYGNSYRTPPGPRTNRNRMLRNVLHTPTVVDTLYRKMSILA